MGNKAIKIFGMERTCTNYVRELIEVNTDFEVWVNTFGGKHALVDPEGWVLTGNWDWRNIYENSTARFVICVKDPYHWLVSIKSYCMRDRFYIAYDSERLLKRFNDMYLHWYLELIEKGHRFFNEGCIVRYEDMLRDPEQILASALGIELNGFKDAKLVRHSSEFSDETRDYYLSPIQDRVVIDSVNDHLSDEFFTLYGYARLQ